MLKAARGGMMHMQRSIRVRQAVLAFEIHSTATSKLPSVRRHVLQLYSVLALHSTDSVCLYIKRHVDLSWMLL
jgi:hypothetical protein